jgi:hypothetical protein
VFSTYIMTCSNHLRPRAYEKTKDFETSQDETFWELTSGSNWDGDLPARLQEPSRLCPFTIGLWSQLCNHSLNIFKTCLYFSKLTAISANLKENTCLGSRFVSYITLLLTKSSIWSSKDELPQQPFKKLQTLDDLVHIIDR